MAGEHYVLNFQSSKAPQISTVGIARSGASTAVWSPSIIFLRWLKFIYLYPQRQLQVLSNWSFLLFALLCTHRWMTAPRTTALHWSSSVNPGTFPPSILSYYFLSILHLWRSNLLSSIPLSWLERLVPTSLFCFGYSILGNKSFLLPPDVAFFLAVFLPVFLLIDWLIHLSWYLSFCHSPLLLSVRADLADIKFVPHLHWSLTAVSSTCHVLCGKC